MTARKKIGTSALEVFPLALGTNVFGWTADEATSHRVLDDYFAAGGNFLDTADSYSFWAPGNVGGESERIIASWFAKRGTRDQVVLATKVSQHPEFTGLAPATIDRAVDASLERLGTDVIDLYYAHFDDAHTPLEDSIAALSALVDAGKVRYLGISNYSPERIEEWLRITEAGGYHRPIALQPQYSLVERGIESTLIPLAQREGLGVVPYYALARGFLTGKYREGADDSASPRAPMAAAYLAGRGRDVLAALDEISSRHGVAQATIALAWLAGRPTVVAPIASARIPEQLPDLLAHVSVELSPAEIAQLDAASEQ
jgi:aryl-alcohol dehydrogenase-like predicted oxidoreductase